MAKINMEAEVKEAIVLLKNLEYQLKHEPYGDLNKFTDFTELYQVIDETIFDLQNKKYEGITLSVRVGKTMSYINDALAFRGLRLSKNNQKHGICLCTQPIKNYKRTR